MQTRGQLYIARVFKNGNSQAICLERDLREALGLRPGDCVMIRVHPPYATIRRAIPEVAVDLSDMRAEDFPPAWPKRGKHAANANDPARVATGTTGPDAGDDERGGAKRAGGID